MHFISRILIRGGKCFSEHPIKHTKTNVGFLSKLQFCQQNQNYSVIKNSQFLVSMAKPLVPCRFMGTEFKIEHEENRFYIKTREGVAHIKYSIDNGVMDIYHTGVPRVFRGHGVGRLLAKAALDYGVQSGLILKISCDFVKSYVQNYGPQYTKYILTSKY